MRLFIAIDLPEEIKRELRTAQQQIPKSKHSKTKDFHITLKFLGDMTPNEVEDIRQKLSQVKFKQFKSHIESLGVFPNETYIRVVWAGTKPETEMKELQEKIDDTIGKKYPDDHKFNAHITLARVKHIEDKKEFVRMLKEIKVTKTEFETSKFKLKKSTLRGKEGPMYEDIQVYKCTN